MNTPRRCPVCGERHLRASVLLPEPLLVGLTRAVLANGGRPDQGLPVVVRRAHQFHGPDAPTCKRGHPWPEVAARWSKRQQRECRRCKALRTRYGGAAALDEMEVWGC